MENDFLVKLSFGGQKAVSSHRENWREALALLPDVIEEQKHLQKKSQLLLALPTSRIATENQLHIEWVITETYQQVQVVLLPYIVDDTTTYQAPSLTHLLNHVTLDIFDREWLAFFTTHCCCDDSSVQLNADNNILDILLTLAQAKRLRLASDESPLCVHETPLQLKARLRFAEEWNLWALDAELLVDLKTNQSISPESLDFITRAGLAAYEGELFLLPVAAAWIAQISASGVWYIAKEQLAEALYQLSLKIRHSDFLHHLSLVQCLKGTPLPVVYLRAKHFEKNVPVTLYLAFHYKNTEVFSKWHGQGAEELPIDFDSSSESCRLYFRNMAAEQALENTLEHEEGLTFVAKKRAWTIQMPALWNVIHYLLQMRWEVWAEKHKIETLSSLGITTASSIGWFELKPIELSSGQLIDPIQLIKYLKRKALFIRLGNDRVCILPERWITKLTGLLDISHFEEEKGWRFSSLYASLVETSIGDDPNFQSDADFRSTVERVRSFDRVQPLTQPEGFRAMLRSYQLSGLTWLNLLCEVGVGGILADDMGLGKTVQILALLQHRILNQPNLKPKIILVISPKSVQAHWFTQAKNLLPRLPCRMLHSRDLSAGQPVNQHVLLLASYGFVKYNIENFSTWQFDLLIIDEAQMIKNDSSQTTQAIKRLKAEQRFALTGTPIENRFEDLVSIFSFLNPLAQLQLTSASSTSEALHLLVKNALHPFVLRRLKEDVLTDLPIKTVNEIILPMTPEQARLHQELLEYYRNEITKFQKFQILPTEDEKMLFLEGLLRLRQVASYPQQLSDTSFRDCTSNKLIYLFEQIPKLIERGHRIVIFSQFLGFLKGIAKSLKTLQIRHTYVDGETLEREREIALFQSDKTLSVLLISLRIGGIGIDLTSTDVCIIADPWWNEAVENQAIDRLHRFGQKKPVTAFRLVSAGSIEEKMEVLKRNKTELANALGKTKDDFLSHLKWEDFTEIF